MLFKKIDKSAKNTSLLASLVLATSLSACTFQPLHVPSASVDGTLVGELSQVNVEQVSTRVAQQVRNHLIFILGAGNYSAEQRYDANLQVTSHERRTSSHTSLSDTTAGFVTVTASYTLIDAKTGKRIAGGSRKASAYFDRTSQIFANQRAVRDAENRASKEVAEKLRHAFATDLRR